jgi:hypothetical protein
MKQTAAPAGRERPWFSGSLREERDYGHIASWTNSAMRSSACSELSEAHEGNVGALLGRGRTDRVHVDFAGDDLVA